MCDNNFMTTKNVTKIFAHYNLFCGYYDDDVAFSLSR